MQALDVLVDGQMQRAEAEAAVRRNHGDVHVTVARGADAVQQRRHQRVPTQNIELSVRLPDHQSKIHEVF